MKHLLRDRVEARWLTRMAGVGLVMGAVVLSGCDGGSDRLASEVELLQTRLEAMHTAGGVPAPEAHRAKVYNEMIAKVQELSEGATEAQRATLALISANAKAGLADIENQHVRAKIADVTRAGSLVRSALDLYMTQHGLADSMLGYSPSEDLASFDDQTVMIETRMARTRQMQVSAEQELAELREAIAALEALVTVERDAAASLRVESLAVDTGSRASMIEQAKDHLIAAADYERQMAELQIEVDQVLPVAQGAQDEVVRLQRQLDRLAMARTTVRDMDRALTQQSEAARKQAGEAGNDVARRFEALVAVVEDELIPAYDGAMSKYSAASSEAGRAQSAGDRTMAKLTTGSIASSMAALAQSQSEALSHLAALVRELESVKPSLPGKERYSQARQRYTELADSAAETYTQQAQKASGSFRGAGDGASREVFTSLADYYGEKSASDDVMNDSGGEIAEPAPDAGG